MTKKIVSIIPARGGSKGIINKNTKEVDGKPLIWYTLESSLNSVVDETWVSTECSKIAQCSLQYNNSIRVLKRPANLATDESSSESVLLHFAQNVDFDILVFIQCTSPLTTSMDINNALKLMGEYDSVVSVCKDHGGWLCGGFLWYDGGVAEYDTLNRQRRQNMKNRYRENGAIYITTKEKLLESKCRISGMVGLYVMPRQRSFEIDDIEDLEEFKTQIGKKT